MNIIPLPNVYKQKSGIFFIKNDSSIMFSKEFSITSKYFLNFIKDKTNLNLQKLEINNIFFLLNLELPLEAYIIDISENTLTVHARSDQGAFYALQSLKQLYYIKDGYMCFDSIYIEDYPRFKYRGFMLDVARHFSSKETVFKIIDYLAMHKLNYLHLHLSDDQGFRIQIDKYPLLTKIGSTRSKTKKLSGSYDNKIHNGFYTKEDIKEIVNYAKDNFIEVVPEIDIPGHTSAIIASYPELSCRNEKIEVETSFGIKKNTLCLSSDLVYNFLYDVFIEISDLFPSKFIHIGADEIKFNNLKKCSKCRELLKKENIRSYKDLTRHFINKLASHLREVGKTPIAWNDLLNAKSNYNIILQHWTPFKSKQTIKEINDGRKAIISNFFHLYLDYPYSMTPLKKTYNFEPVLKGILRPDNVIGIEATLWTEWIDNLDKLQEHIFPRLAAVSEIAWSNVENKNYEDFLNRLKHLSISYNQLLINIKQDYSKSESLIKRVYKTIKWYKGKEKRV